MSAVIPPDDDDDEPDELDELDELENSVDTRDEVSDDEMVRPTGHFQSQRAQTHFAQGL